MEVEVGLVLGPVDSLEIANYILMNVCSEGLRGPDLVIGGYVEGKEPGRSGYDLMVDDFNGRQGRSMIATYVGLFDWVDFERSEASANIGWGDPFLAGDCSTGVTG